MSCSEFWILLSYVNTALEKKKKSQSWSWSSKVNADERPPGGAAKGWRCPRSSPSSPGSPRTMSWIRRGKMAATDHSRSEAAKQRRQDQLQRWLGSETDRTDAESRSGGGGSRRSKVRFAQGAVFMAACSAGDREEVAALLRQGADINHANIDGLTALHQVQRFCKLDPACRRK